MPLLFGPHFEQARSPFLVLGLVSCLQSVSLPLAMLVFATRNAGSMLRINLVCVVVDAALAIGLVPLIGLWGAVTANASAQLLSVLLISTVAIRRLGVDVTAVTFGCYPLILGFGAAGVAVALAHVTAFPIGVLLVLAPLAGVTVVFIGLSCLPTWRVSAGDAGLVEVSLPGWLRAPYRWITHSFNLVAPVRAEPH